MNLGGVSCVGPRLVLVSGDGVKPGSGVQQPLSIIRTWLPSNACP